MTLILMNFRLTCECQPHKSTGARFQQHRHADTG